MPQSQRLGNKKHICYEDEGGDQRKKSKKTWKKIIYVYTTDIYLLTM